VESQTVWGKKMTPKTKLSKKHTLVKLAPSWREKIFSSIKSERLKLAVAVISATGCRPSELERGIVIRLRDKDLSIAIQGSKVDLESRRGQPLRLLHIDCTTPWGEYLMQHVINSIDHRMLVKYDAGGISQRMREKSRELWPRRKSLVSAYCYRHFFAKSLKESGAGKEKIASALGHASDLAQTAYGRVGKGKKSAGSHGLISVEASNPIRHSKKTDRLDRFIGSVMPVSNIKK